MPRHTFRRRLDRGLLALALLAAVGPAGAAEADAAAEASKATVTTMREIGSAMFFWAVEAAGERDGEAATEAKAEAEPATVRWSRCPAASYDEVRQLLVPRFIAELPRTDGWGHPLELCLDREGVKAHGHFVLGVRSAGADGRFDGDEYTVGAFDLAEANHDLVWLDGYFIAWPMRKPAS